MTTPAGWYPDPQDAQQLRYFDGRDWGSQSVPRPAVNGAGQPVPGQATSGQPFAGQATSGQPFAGQATSGHASAGQFFVRQDPAGQVTAGPSWEAEPTHPSSGAVWPLILAALIGIVIVVGLGISMSDKGEPKGLTASELGIPSDFGCSDLYEAYVEVLPVDPSAEEQTEIISSVGKLTEVENNIGTVTQPNEGSGKENLIIACEGPGTFGDGSQEDVRLELTIDGDGQVWVGGLEK